MTAKDTLKLYVELHVLYHHASSARTVSTGTSSILCIDLVLWPELAFELDFELPVPLLAVVAICIGGLKLITTGTSFFLFPWLPIVVANIDRARELELPVLDPDP